MIRLTCAALALALGAVPLAACNTIHGMGKDIEAAGRTIANLPDGDEQKRQPRSRAKAAQPAAQTPSQRPATSTSKTGS